MITVNRAAALAVLLGCGFSCAAQAEGPGYDFLDLNYALIVPQDVPGVQDGTGLEVNGSYGLPADFTVVAAFGRDNYDIQGLPSAYYEVTQELSTGLGYHYALTPRIDLEAEVDYFGDRAWVETPTTTSSSIVSHGVDYDIGLRAMATDSLELHGFVGKGRVNGTNTDSHGWSAGFIYDVTPSIGLGLSYHRERVDASPPVKSGPTSYSTRETVFFARLYF